MSGKLDKQRLLERLERVDFKTVSGGDVEQLSTMSLVGSLLSLARIDHEQEYAILRRAAEHLLAKVPEPDDADLLEE